MPDARSWFKKFSFGRKRKAPEPMASGALPAPWPVPNKVNIAATALPIPPPAPGRSSLSSINLQPSPTNSFWLPAPTDDFWKPAQPTERNKRLRHTVSSPFIEAHLSEVGFDDDIYGSTPPQQSRNPFPGRQQPQSIHFTDTRRADENIHQATPQQSRNPFFAPQQSRNPFLGPRQSTPSLPSAPLSVTETKDCAICADTKPLHEFPLLCVSQECDHPPETCLECIKTHIRTAVNDKVWHARVVTCPQCDRPMEYNEVQEYSDPATFAKYDARILHDATAESSDFFSCPASGCESSQIHDGGDDAPIVRCLGCLGRFCFRHRVVWHETMSCREYDEFLKDPENFKSALERENEKVERERLEAERRKRDMEEADRKFAQALIEDEERRREAEIQAEKERAARRELERQEAERRAAQEKVAAENRARAAREAKRRADENKASEAVVSRTTKKCPGRGCGRPIEKNDGCAHMTCLICKHNFCYDCLADYNSILKTDNTAHKKTCQWHPNNLRA
ncbi:hypothetical protein V8F20_010129 [Naviculisporaceae sp. PSN 640]